MPSVYCNQQRALIYCGAENSENALYQRILTGADLAFKLRSGISARKLPENQCKLTGSLIVVCWSRFGSLAGHSTCAAVGWYMSIM